MKRATILIATCAAVLFFAQCSEKMHIKEQTPAEEIAGIKTQYTPGQIAKGKTIFESKCGECHDLRQPPEFTIHEWNKILPSMVHKAGLEKDDAGIVKAWIITNAKAG